MFRINQTVAIAVVLSCCATNLPAKGPTFTDPNKTGIDFQIQGEYAGTVASDNAWGAHVIALGNGKFKAIGYRGGLPGRGWNGHPGQYIEGTSRDDVAVLRSEEFELHVDGKVMKILRRNGELLGRLEKQQRESETLGMKPPAEAIVLFDGTSTDQWNNAKLVDGKHLAASGCETKAKFADHRLHIEFRTPFMPEDSGQARGNSGVYVQSRYEVQVLDSFGLEGKDNECGGIYGISRPKLNMCHPPLAWQTYDIEFKAAKYDEDGNKAENARITVRHNGVVIHDDLELPRGTPGRHPEGPGPAALFLQDHGDPVVYRNIWVVRQ